MNFNVLKYVIEVERSRSITAAARQLFISQPNLSRDIKELEEEIGFAIFTRSSRGVVPTERGREFLQLARKAVRQYQTLEHYCSREEKDSLRLKICVPKCSCPGSVLAAFLARHGKGRRLEVDYRETDGADAVEQVLLRSCSCALLHCPDRWEKPLLALLKRKELACEVLSRLEPEVLMSERHPLAGTSQLSADMLEGWPEVVCEDTGLAAMLHESQEVEHGESCVRVHQRGVQLELLEKLPGSFALTPPVSEAVLARYRLVQKKLPGPSRKTAELLIYPEDCRLTRTERGFIELISGKAPETAQQKGVLPK